MSLAKVYWTRRVALVLALTVGILSGGQGRFAAAAPQIIETTITKDRLAGADFGALSPGVDTVKLILNGPYDPKTNPKGYTGSVIYPPEGSIWKKTVDAQGRHIYQIAVTSQTDSTLLASTTTCTGSGSGPCDETKTCTITTDGANGCGGSTSLSAQSVPTRTKAERLSKSEPGGGVRMPQMLSGSSFPDARNIHRVPHRTIHVNVTPQKAQTKAKSTTETIGYLRFTITGKGVALYRKAGKKQITEDTQISVGPKGLDEDFYFVTNGDFKEPVTIQSHFTYADNAKDTEDGETPNCEDQFGSVPCCIPTVTHIPPDPQCCSCDPNDCKGVTMYGSIMLPNSIGSGGGLGYNGSVYNNPTNANLYDSGNPCGQSSNSTSAMRAATGDTINGVFPTGINFGNGMNQIVREWPFISFAMGEKAYTMLVVFGGQEMFWFDGSSNSNNYTARYGAKQTLTYDESSQFFILTQSDGTVYKFNNLNDDQTNVPGLFYESVAPNGKISRVTQYVDTNGDETPDRIGEIRRGTLVNEQFLATEKLVYNFVHPQQGTVDYLQDVTTSRSTDGTTWTPIRKVAFTYTSSGDQETVSESVPDGQNSWATVGTRYYRYWNNHLVKYVFEPQAYANLVAAVSNPLQAEDSAVASFASHYFEYDSSRRVTRHDQLGGTRSSTFSYYSWAAQEGQVISQDFHFYQDTVNLNPNTPNQWMTKITETWTDNSQAQTTAVTRTTYVNQLGQPIIKDLVCGDSRWIEYYKYDDNYRLILHAEPSAIAGCDTTVSTPESSTACRVGTDGFILIYGGNWTSVPSSIRKHCEDELEEYQRTWPFFSHQSKYPYYVSVYHLLIQRSAASSASFKLDGNNEENVGLVHTYSYYDTGDVAPGYLRYENVRHGNAGSDIRIRENVYTSHTYNNTVKVYNIEKSKVFPGELESSQPYETSYAYTYHTGTNAIAERITTLPAIDTTHNGSGTANVRKEYLDIDGNVVWLKDERGSFTYNSYDSLTGAIVQTIQDVKSGQGLTPPTGWGDLPASGLHVVTDYTHDIRGRITQILGPAHLSPLPSGEGQGEGSVNVRTASWTVYDDANHTTRTAQGYQVVSTGAYTLVNPVSITKTDLDGRVLEQIQAVRGSGVTSSGALSASDTFAQSSYTRWSVNTYSNTLLTSSRVYHLIPSSGVGTAGTNYAETTYTYNSVGRVVKTIAPNGTIQRGVLDIRGHVVKSYVGTSDTNATNADPTGGSAAGNNMILLAENQYDGGGCSCGANGNITQTTRYVDASTTRVTSHTYDWRDRRLTTSASDGTTTYIAQNTYDNLNRITQVDQYHSAAQDANLVGRSKKYYDEFGRVYKTETYAVDPSTGTVGTALASNTWYDAAGNAIKQKPAGSNAFKKTAYDLLGRAVKRYLGYDTTESNYVDASTVDNDTIFEQTETIYDTAGNVIIITNRSRLHDATGTGELTSPDGSQPKARVSYSATWYDPVGRKIATANYGTNSGTVLTRPDSAPTRSDTALVSSAEYDATGKAFSVTDSSGKVFYREFDAHGRVTKTIQNYVEGGTADDQNVTVETAYAIDGQVSTLTAKNSTTGDQVTRYIYGTTLTDNKVARADLLRGVIYPDSDDTTSLGSGSDGVYDHIEYKYNRLGEPIEVKDQNGTIHEYIYDGLGRQTADKITTVGSGVNDSVRRIARTFEVRGMTEHVTSYDAATDGNVVNDVQLAYNTFGQLIADYQSHSGTVNTSTSPKVQYAYADGSANHVRLTSVTYPNGRVLTYGYSTGNDSALSRVSYLVDSDNTHLAEYTYLGVDRIIKADHPQPSLLFNLSSGSGNDPYDGVDRFGRVVDHLWRNYNNSTDAARIKHGYDRTGNRLWRQDTVSTAQTPAVYLDEIYTYDGVNQLTALNRGQLNANRDGLVSNTKDFAEQWTLDPLGNWTAFKQDATGDGTWDLDQTRGHNQGNETTQIDGSSTNIAHDLAGNMTKTPKPGDWSSHYTLTWDAWNRLVKVSQTSGESEETVAEYQYDGCNSRTVKKTYSSGTLSETRHFYYHSDWQVLEDRLGDSTFANRQNIWGVRYIDDLVLRDRDADTNSETGSYGTTGSGLEERLYALQDSNWNMIAIAGTDGAVVERYKYSAYGKPIFLTETFGSRSSSNYDWDTLYTGRQCDFETGLYQYRNRFYNTELGKFVSRDPIESELNLYRYVYNSPLIYLDPSGLFWDEFWAAADASISSVGSGISNLGSGAWNAGAETAYYVRDVGAVYADTVVTGTGVFASYMTDGAIGNNWGLGVQEWSQVGINNQPNNPNFVSNALWNAGRSGLAAGSLGSSEITIGTCSYLKTGDAVAFQQHVGGVAALNLAGVALSRGAGMLRNSGSGVLKGTNVRGQVTSRGSFRKGTIQDAWDNATNGPNGGKKCPTCGDEVSVPPGSGPRDWDIDHQPPWTKREFPENVNRKQVLDNYQEGTRLECPPCNRCRGNK